MTIFQRVVFDCSRSWDYDYSHSANIGEIFQSNTDKQFSWSFSTDASGFEEFYLSNELLNFLLYHNA